MRLDKAIRKSIWDHTTDWQFDESRRFLRCDGTKLVRSKVDGRWRLILPHSQVHLSLRTHCMIELMRRCSLAFRVDAAPSTDTGAG